MHLLQALRNAAIRMEADLEDSKLFTHPGDKGEFREHVIGKFLRPFLPNCYGIGSGLVFSADGSASHSVDIVVYDDVFSNVLFRDSVNNLFPCESVYGTIEVKSVLSTEELEKSIANIASVKRLPRAATSGLDVTPTHQIKFTGEVQFTPNAYPSNAYLGIVFAYDGLSPIRTLEVLNSHLVSGQYPMEHLPNFVFLHKHGTTILRIMREGTSARIVAAGEPFNAYLCHASSTDTLPLFFLTVNAILNGIRLRAPDFGQYWRQVIYQVNGSTQSGD